MGDLNQWAASLASKAHHCAVFGADSVKIEMVRAIGRKKFPTLRAAVRRDEGRREKPAGFLPAQFLGRRNEERQVRPSQGWTTRQLSLLPWLRAVPLSLPSPLQRTPASP